MLKIFSIAWKDTLNRFSDRTELLFFIILPIIFSFLLRGMGGGGGDSTALLLVVDEDRSTLSGELLTSLASEDTLKTELVTRPQAEEQFADKDAHAWLLIPSGFEQSLLAGESTALSLQKLPKNNEADGVERSVGAAVSAINRPLVAARASLAEAERVRPFDNPADQQAYFTASLDAARQKFDAAPERVTVTRPPETGSDYDPAAQASAGQLITWVFIPLLGTSGLFAYERNQKTLHRLLTTPTNKATFLLGAITGQLSAGLVQMVLLVGVGAWILGVNWGNSPSALAVVLVSFGLASVAMGVTLGTFIKTEKQASNLSIMLGMVMALLGGCWWPMELFPDAMRTAVKILPTTWGMNALTDLSMRGMGLADVLPAVGVLLGFAVVFFGVGVARFRYE